MNASRLEVSPERLLKEMKRNGIYFFGGGIQSRPVVERNEEKRYNFFECGTPRAPLTWRSCGRSIFSLEYFTNESAIIFSNMNAEEDTLGIRHSNEYMRK